MDRSTRHKLPYFPRYKPLSSAASTQAGCRKFSFPKNFSNSRERIYYINGGPTRVINSYNIQNLSSSNRTYNMYVCSTKENYHLMRVRRSPSVYDFNSSHVYTSNEFLHIESNNQIEAPRTSSAEELFHNLCFFPDVTPSESGVSVGEWEDESAFGGDEESMSQYSMGSSSTFCEANMDDKWNNCDSDNFNETNCIKDKTWDFLHMDVVEENSMERHLGFSNEELKESNISSNSLCLDEESVNRNRRHTFSSTLNDPIVSADLSTAIPCKESSAGIFTRFKGDDTHFQRSTSLGESASNVGEGRSMFYVSVNGDTDGSSDVDSNHVEDGESETSGTEFDLVSLESDTEQLARLGDVSSRKIIENRYQSENYRSQDNPFILFDSHPVDMVRYINTAEAASERLTVSSKCTVTEQGDSGAIGKHDNSEKLVNYKPSVENDESVMLNVPLVNECKRRHETSRQLSTSSVCSQTRLAANSVKTKNWENKNCDRGSAHRININSECWEKPKEDQLNSFMECARGETLTLGDNSKGEPTRFVSESNLSQVPGGAGEDNQVNEEAGSSSESEIPITKEDCVVPRPQVCDNLGLNAEQVGPELWVIPSKHFMDGVAPVKGHQFLNCPRKNRTCLIDSSSCHQYAMASEACWDMDNNISLGVGCHADVKERTISKRVDSQVVDELRQTRNNDVTKCTHNNTIVVPALKPSTESRVITPGINDTNNQTSFYKVKESSKLHGENLFTGNQDMFSQLQTNYNCTENQQQEARETSHTDTSISPRTIPYVCDKHSRKEIIVILTVKCSYFKLGISTSNDGGLPENHRAKDESDVSTCPDNHSYTSCGESIDQTSLKKPCIRNNIWSMGQRHSDDGIFSEFAGNKNVNNEYFAVQSDNIRMSDFNSWDFPESIGELCLTGSGRGRDIDWMTGSNAFIETDQQQTQFVSPCHRDSASDNRNILEENTSEDNVIDLVLADTRGSRHPAACGETPPTITNVIASQEIENNININNPTLTTTGQELILPSKQQRAEIFRLFTNCSQSPCNFSEPYKRTNLSTFSSKTTRRHVYTGDWENNIDNSHIRELKSNEKSRNISKQQENSAVFCAEIPTAIFDGSIKHRSKLKLRRDKGIHQVGNFCASSEERDEYTRCSGLERKQLTNSSIGFNRNIHLTNDCETVVIENRYLTCELNGDAKTYCDFVDEFVNSSPTEIHIKHGASYVTTKTTFCPGLVTQNSVSTQNISFDSSCYTWFSPAASVSITQSSTPVFRNIINKSTHSPTDINIASSLSSSLSTHETVPDIHTMKENCDSRRLKDIVPGQIYPFAIKNVDIIPITDLHRMDVYPGSLLDNLQAQLSLISDNKSRTRTHTEGREVYSDDVNAVKSSKQSLHFYNNDLSDCSYSFKICIPKESSANSLCTSHETGAVQTTSRWRDSGDTEQYDNDYDYVTNEHPAGTKHFPRSRHHLQLLKCGQLKASSLWTLFEESEDDTADMLPKSSLKPSMVTVLFNGECESPSFSVPNHSVTKTVLIRMDERTKNSSFGQRDFVPEDSYFDQNKMNYSACITADGVTGQSSSSGPKQTLLNDMKSVSSDLSADTRSGTTGISSCNRCTTVDRKHDQPSPSQREKNTSLLSESSLTVSGSRYNYKEMRGDMSILDRLSEALSLFNTGNKVVVNEKNYISLPQTIQEPYSGDNCPSQSKHLGKNDVSNEVSRVQNLDLDETRNSICDSQMPSGVSHASLYMSMGTAEFAKVDDDYYDNSVYTLKMKNKLNIKTTTPPDEKDNSCDFKMSQFQILANELSSVTQTENIPEKIVLDGTDSAASKCQDLYEAFSNQHSEKTQNHSCIAVAEENMNSFRFSRFLKKSHNKRKKGIKVLRFLSKLGCVSEAACSPTSSPNQQRKLRDKGDVAKTTSTEITSSIKHISSPILMSSTSFHHQNILLSQPHRSVDNCSIPSYSNQSLDSLLSRADSAYSSISESAAGVLNSPVCSHVSNSPLLDLPEFSGHDSETLHSDSTFGSNSFLQEHSSSNLETTLQHMDTSSAAELTFVNFPFPQYSSGPTREEISALSEVLSQLDISVNEIDTALLAGTRVGNIPAGESQHSVNGEKNKRIHKARTENSRTLVIQRIKLRRRTASTTLVEHQSLVKYTLCDQSTLVCCCPGNGTDIMSNFGVCLPERRGTFTLREVRSMKLLHTKQSNSGTRPSSRHYLTSNSTFRPS